MNDFMQQALSLRPQEAPSWLLPRHEDGRSHWHDARFPDRKTEHWKHTSLRALEQGAYVTAGLSSLAPLSSPLELQKADLQRHYQIADLNAASLVFVDGRYAPSLSSATALPDGVELLRFSEASDTQAQQIEVHLGTVIERDQHLFAALNDSWLEDGVFLHVSKGIRVKTPIQIVWLTTAQPSEFSLAQRLLVLLDAGSEATVIEHFASNDEIQNSFTTGVTELVLAANARLHHYRLQLEEEHALHIGGVHASLDRDAFLNSFQIALGSTLKRIDVVINHCGEGAHSELHGVYLPRHQQHVDFHTSVEHRVPNCSSNEIFRGIVGDSGRAVFNGRIHIYPDAQKSSARLSNKNLLTSDKAQVDTKPELEIYADDVQCAHGATVAQLDEGLLYYLCTRGISRKEAEVMLSFGFINEMLNKLQHAQVGDYLRPLLTKLFAEDPRLARHIL